MCFLVLIGHLNVGGPGLNDGMTFLADDLDAMARALAGALASARDRGAVALADDDELVALLQVAGRLQRLVDGLIVETVDRVESRDQCERAARLTTQAGCRDTTELLQRTLLADRPSARRYLAAASAVHRDLDLSAGDLLPPRYPALARALTDGAMSLGGFLACAVPLERARARIDAGDFALADELLAAAAVGEVPGGGVRSNADADRAAPAPTADELAALTAHVLARVDPDGAVPDDRAAEHQRFFALGRQRHGAVPVRGSLLPEVAGQLQRLIDAYDNPRVRFVPDAQVPAGLLDVAESSEVPPERAAELRTAAQRRHDAFGAIVMLAAGSTHAPQLGGAAPTLVVSVTAAEFASGVGRASIESADYDAPLATASHVACAGGVQRVLFDEHGAIVAIGTSARIFTAHQRRAIVLRDRECLIPGCHVRADWCEIHHVREHSRGGPTHTSNGVALCWHHHRTLDSGPWRIRMRDGCPEIRGPAWWDPQCRWRSPRQAYAAVDQILDRRDRVLARS